ncbi:hypothetical protein BDM02DRAFT_607219 [Thelephora ganbajun]|uniref:Uncharacterized protein n=1 Tax=Thelephora ganbajun TaxID=370292 RepID=A0ACB6Z6U7_THEGA|nr:hypothetical protein BDM02DRAFT_607219 [Thelephora ganbajun]
MVCAPETESEDSCPQASSSKVKIANGASCLQIARGCNSPSVRLAEDKNPLADFAFDKLPTELLVEIFNRARADNVRDAYNEKYPYPVALAQVCRYWRRLALGAPTLWTNIRVTKYYTEGTREVARIYLERSKTCPIFLTWFSKSEQTAPDAQGVINDLIIPGAERWQRITLIAENEAVPGALLTAMRSLDFPILRDVEISSLLAELSPSAEPTLCRNAPLLRRCKFRGIPSLPPLPLNLVVLDCVFAVPGLKDFSLDPLLEFLPHVAHSLEHLRFGPPTSEVLVTPRRSRIPLENLKSLLVKDSHIIMDYIRAPNLTYFAAFHPLDADARKVAEMFNGFSAPKLQSIRFHKTPLLPFLTMHNLPSMFPELESVMLSGCINEPAFASLLEPAKPKKPSSLQNASKYLPKHRKVENPFPKLKEVTISDMTTWTSLQAAIEKRLKNGDKSLRKIQLPKEDVTETIMPHLRRWLPAQGIEFVLYGPGELPMSTPEFQDDFCNEEIRLFFEIMEESEWGDDDDDDYDYWEERDMFHPDYELPNDYFDDFYDDYEEEDEEDEDEDEDEEDDFYQG